MHRPAGAAVPGGAAPAARSCGDRLVLHRPERGGRRGARAGARRRHAAAGRRRHAMPFPALQSAFDALYPPGLQWYWRADFFRRAHRRGDRARTPSTASSCRRCTRRCTSTRSTARPHDVGRERHAPSATATRAGRRSSSASTPTRPTPARSRAVGVGLLGGAAPVLGRRRLRQLHDGRGPGPGPGDLPRQLRPAGPGQGAATTRRTSSASTRTSAPPLRDAEPVQQRVVTRQDRRTRTDRSRCTRCRARARAPAAPPTRSP